MVREDSWVSKVDRDKYLPIHWNHISCSTWPSNNSDLLDIFAKLFSAGSNQIGDKHDLTIVSNIINSNWKDVYHNDENETKSDEMWLGALAFERQSAAALRFSPPRCGLKTPPLLHTGTPESVFVPLAKCIFPIRKMYLSKLDRYLFRPWDSHNSDAA